MSDASRTTRYREYLRRLNYAEYAYGQHNEQAEQRLNLSLWNDDLPPGVLEAAIHALPTAVGAYKLAQDEMLISLLAKRHGVPPDTVLITAGADDALRVVSQYCIRTGTRTLIPLPSFGRYTYHALIQRAKIYHVAFSLFPHEFDTAKICDEVGRKKIECLYLASPNNPTGHALGQESMRMLLGAVPCSVILDESLLLRPFSMCSMITAGGYEHVFICGSFSKLYSMPGLRVGYIIAHRAHIETLRKLLSPFGVDALALEIAKHLIAHDDWLRHRVTAIDNGIATLCGINDAQLQITHTSSPVALIEYTGTRGKLYDLLRERGISTIAGAEFPGLEKANAVRVIIKSVKDMLELKGVLAAIS